jgi:hypothetical protein
MAAKDTANDTPRKGAPCIIVIFGASGDLTKRKLIPAIYHLAVEKLLPKNFGLVGFARADMDSEKFRAQIDAELKRIGSTLTVNDLMTRADLQNCHGCHLGNVPVGEGVVFPPSFAGTHVDERRTPNGTFMISPALRDVFAPNRVKILTDFLAGRPMPVHSNSD